jgi:hypothetical protein
VYKNLNAETQRLNCRTNDDATIQKFRVLVACEYSGRVRDAFIALGHDAMSCDLLPTDVPGPHYQGDVRDVIGDGWNLMVSHPPCTYLCSSGLHWNKRTPGRQALTDESIEFVRLLLDAPIKHIALENPIGCISTLIRKPEQTIQPWQFGEDASKSTCLWLKNLPLLTHTEIIEPRWVCCGIDLPDGVGKYGCVNCVGDKKPRPRWANQTNSGQNKLPPSEDRWKTRSETYRGIAQAMAEQWSRHIKMASQLTENLFLKPTIPMQNELLFERVGLK